MTDKLAWNEFKQTGDINAYLKFKEVINMEENMKVSIDESIKSKWNYNK